MERSSPDVQAADTVESRATAPTGPVLAVVVLAAGQGSRLRSRVPKPLHRVGGRPLIDHVLRAAAILEPAQTIVITGHGAATVHEHLQVDAPTVGRGGLITVHQAEQLGTGHAVMVALPHVSSAVTDLVILYADTPLVTDNTLARLLETRRREGAIIGLVTCIATDPTGYGRIVRGATGQVAAIVEEKAASATQRGIAEINAGIYAVDAGWLRKYGPTIERGPAGEYYLTDIVGLAVGQARANQPWPVTSSLADISEALGVNDRVQLAEAEAHLRAQTLRRLMLAGVTIVDPATTRIDDDVTIGQDTIIHPFSILTAGTTIGTDCTIGPGARIVASTLGNGCAVVDSTVEHSTMANGSNVGPYSHLRPGAALGEDVHVGNFAEVKNSQLGARTAMGHVGYLGDADVGVDVNIGAGTITANYDGRHKHRTTIGDGAFLGVDSVLRAPLHVGPGARTGAGAVVIHDVPAGATVVGVPARPIPPRQRRDEDP